MYVICVCIVRYKFKSFVLLVVLSVPSVPSLFLLFPAPRGEEGYTYPVQCIPFKTHSTYIYVLYTQYTLYNVENTRP